MITVNKSQSNNKHNMLDYINCNIIALLIFANSLQMGIFWAFGIPFNLWWLYGLIAIMYMLNKRIISYSLMLAFIVFNILLASAVLFSNDVIMNYVKEFLIFAMPLILIFAFSIDYNLLAKTCYYYALLGLLVYIVIIILRIDSFGNEYMTFGYHAIYFATYVFLYSYYNKKGIILIASLVTMVPILWYGSRGVLLVIVVMFISLLLLEMHKNIKVKLISVGGLILMWWGGYDFLLWMIDTVMNKLNINSYSLWNLKLMLEASSFQDLLKERYYIYQYAIEAIKHNLVFGMGIGSYQASTGSYPHNIFLDVYTTFGIFLGTAFFVFLIVIGMKALKHKGYPEVRMFMVFSLANVSRLMFSKTFVYDSTMWFYIVLCISIITNYKKLRVNDYNPRLLWADKL